jgi:hypothetical protein
MVKVTFVCVAIVGLALPGLVQGKHQTKSTPNLTGTWLLDRSKTNISKPRKTPSNSATPIKITHRDPEFKINRAFDVNGQTVMRDLIYYTDGRGETNPAEIFLTDGRSNLDSAKREKDLKKSTTRWSGNKLVTRSILRSFLGGHLVEFELIETWNLSADGNTLAQTSRLVFQPNPLEKSIYVPSTAPDIKRVYSRIPD